MKTKLDMRKIAKALHAERKGRVESTGGYFGAAQLVADVTARFKVPAGGGHPIRAGLKEGSFRSRQVH